ncbi:chemotaxis protein CheW [Oceanospirillum linum]|uniref:Chemotaxis protein CheW n=1 Tax=Oceanospirillum linum TaxID=966 RepID=A0A1T1HAK6_OCELI|nr:chemotaxis protein CheW [Oceanospirillum linum]OOV86806.1 chemotaxis protein CheW [Oceanospirillum linum]SEG21946.1 purine-binding chemotaxis protein CheW [Oleiphilus messinensis]SMP25234.1 purine-binding chemotaxis protein CheW [Oceanospirillum linum]
MAEQIAENQDHSEYGRLLGQEYLTFSLGEEYYAVDILKVQEIRGYGAVTKIANAPSFIKGVINLRGVIVPIIDLRIKFNLGKAHYDEFTIVIVLNLTDRVVGMVVDGVSDVVSLAGDDIKNPPDFSANFDSEYILGLATVDEQMLIITDIEKLMSSEEMALVDKTKAIAE